MNTVDPRRWLLIAPELSLTAEADGTGGWWIDHLFLDQDAIPTIVEVKRSSDTRIRREVVGQMLDYAAHLEVYWPAARIRATFEERSRADGDDPDAQVRELLMSDDADIEAFWVRVGDNLATGKMRLLFVADEIPLHLQRVVEFLNNYMPSIEVLAVEIKQFEGSNLKTLVPRVLGQTVQTQGKQTTGTSRTRESRQWDEAQFFDVLTERRGVEEANVARKLLEWAKPLRVVWAKGTSNSAFSPVFDHGKRAYSTFSVWASPSSVEILFQYIKDYPPFDQESLRLELAHRLNAIPGVPVITMDRLTKRPSLPLSALTDEASLQAFIDTFDWYLETIRGSAP